MWVFGFASFQSRTLFNRLLWTHPISRIHLYNSGRIPADQISTIQLFPFNNISIYIYIYPQRILQNDDFLISEYPFPGLQVPGSEFSSEPRMGRLTWLHLHQAYRKCYALQGPLGMHQVMKQWWEKSHFLVKYDMQKQTLIEKIRETRVVYTAYFLSNVGSSRVMGMLHHHELFPGCSRL